MNNFIIIKVENFRDRFLRKLISSNLYFYDVKYIDKDKLLVKINLEDYKKVKRLGFFSKIKVVKYEGYVGIKKHFKNNLYFYLMAIFCFILMDIITSFVVSVEVIHENSRIRNLVTSELYDSGIKRFSLRKDFDEIEVIKNKILIENKNSLEWLSITRIGMTYTVRVEERIITNIDKEEGFRHIISTKNALVTKVVSSRGDVLVRSGDYVKKGDILISGNINLYEEVKGNILATGDVYGTVWYTTEINFPFVYEEKVYTGEVRSNLKINNKVLFKNKYKDFDKKDVKSISVFGLKFSFYKEHEYKLVSKRYNNKDAENKALEKIKEEFETRLNDKGVVISQKVLKKEENNSTMSMSVFVVTNEHISKPLYYEYGSEENDTKDSN